MDYARKLERLQHLRSLIGKGDVGSTELVSVYGEISDVYEAIIGRHRIAVPPGQRDAVMYPNLFEAGFMSGRTFYTGQGVQQLEKVIGVVKAKVEEQKRATSARDAASDKGDFGREVFIVHGHNEEALQGVARFVEKLRLPATVLREQAHRGRTIIEKFEDQSEVGFAIVLLTGDDRGAPSAARYEDQRPRARQNVVFELGYFVGKLGRDRVCALYEDGVEIPSDFHGVAFIPLDDRQAWRLELARELKAAGLQVDMNDAI